MLKFQNKFIFQVVVSVFLFTAPVWAQDFSKIPEKGKVTMIDIKEILDTHYIRICGDDEDNTKSVKCMFDKKYAHQLQELQKDQQVTVRGTFDGSLIAIRMVNCYLVER